MTTQPGWYRDPSASGQLRFYDGSSWTEHVQPDPTDTQQPTLAPANRAPHSPPPNVPAVATQCAAPQSFDRSHSGSAVVFGQPHPAEQWGRSTIYRFDGGAGTYLAAMIAAVLVAVLSLGICVPFSVVIFQRWRANHTLLLGRQLAFTGSATHLFGLWIKWWFFILITFGIYSFWVGPRFMRWIVEHTDVAPGPVVTAQTARVPLRAMPPTSASSAPAPAALPHHTGVDPFHSPPMQQGAPAQAPASGQHSSWYD